MDKKEMDQLGLVSRELQRKDNLTRLSREAGHALSVAAEDIAQRGSMHGSGIIGGRPDGTMQPTSLPEGARRGRANLLGAGSAGADPVEQVRNYVGDARRIIDNFEKSTIELESKVAQLSAQLDGERAARQSLEKMITEISRLVAPQ